MSLFEFAGLFTRRDAHRFVADIGCFILKQGSEIHTIEYFKISCGINLWSILQHRAQSMFCNVLFHEYDGFVKKTYGMWTLGRAQKERIILKYILDPVRMWIATQWIILNFPKKFGNLSTSLRVINCLTARKIRWFGPNNRHYKASSKLLLHCNKLTFMLAKCKHVQIATL